LPLIIYCAIDANNAVSSMPILPSIFLAESRPAATFCDMKQRNPAEISVAMGVAAETADSNRFLIKVRENSVSSSDGLTALNWLTDVPEFQML
jgi:hypothetical protein